MVIRRDLDESGFEELRVHIERAELEHRAIRRMLNAARIFYEDRDAQSFRRWTRACRAVTEIRGRHAGLRDVHDRSRAH
jgi:hypothetical protein